MTEARKELSLLITDSGLGGLSICAEIERNLRLACSYDNVRITYFNAWPEERRGYNDLPDDASRALQLERALERMGRFLPDRILIACNTLSVLYPLTDHSRRGVIPVVGIIDAGVDLFLEALRADPVSSIVTLGTRTTIESGVHRDRLLEAGIEGRRIVTVSCHGLATAIEADTEGPAVARLVEKCASEACAATALGDPVYVGLCCTHYTYVKDLIRTALAARSGRTVLTLDPNQRLASRIAPAPQTPPSDGAACRVTVEVVSKVELGDGKRRMMAERIRGVSAATARALLSYAHIPDLF